MAEHTPQRHNSISGNPINKLAEIIAGIASHQRPQMWSAIFRPTTTNTLLFESNKEYFELFENLFQSMLKFQPEMYEAMKFNQFHSQLRRVALPTSRSKVASNERTLEKVLKFRR